MAFIDAGFHLAEYYVVHSENPVSVHIRTLRALRHDAVLVLDPAPIARDWSLPDQVNVNDSRSFTADCSAVLGWLLDSGCGESEILECWTALLKGSNNGNALSC